MALRFVIGSSGSGKSTYIYKKIIDASMEDMRRRFLVIVPEQFTLSTQRQLVDLHPAHSILNIDILSFDRLAYRVFDEFSESGLTLLDDTAKNLILRRVAEDVSDELLVLGKKLKNPGYIDQVKSLLSEFEQYHIDADGISALSNVPGVSPAFKNKIHDLLIIQKKYMEYIGDGHVTAEARYERLSNMLAESKTVRGAVVVLDGYTGFTPIQNVLLREIISLSADTYVTVTMDVRETIFGGREHELFWMSKRMIKSLTDIARDAGVETGEPVLIEGGDRSRFIPGGRLSHLEKNIFLNTRAHGRFLPYQGESADEIKLYRLDSPREELMFAASMIRRMVAESADSEHPYTYSDFAIVSGAPENYEPYIEGIFNDYDIPVFSDSTTEAEFLPGIEFLLSALSILNFDFRYDDVIGFLRSGLTGLSTEDIDLFDHYLYRTGIRGRGRYSHVFTIRPSEFSEDEHTRINEIREWIVKSMSPLSEVFYERTLIGEKSAKVRQLILDFDIEKELFDTIIELLEKMEALLFDVEVDGEEFFGLLSAGLSAIELGSIPEDFDRVIFGDIERTRLSGIKKLFLIGANDGVIPRDSASPNIFSQNERQVLSEAGVELAPTIRERSFMQRFYLYELLTQGSEGLYITYARLDTEGTSLRPSYLIDEIRRLFLGLDIEVYDRNTRPDFWISKKTEAEDTFIMLLRQLIDMRMLSGERATLFNTLYDRLNRDDPDGLSDILSAAFYEHRDEAVSRSVMRAINGQEMHVSVSRLEKYAACAYSYFSFVISIFLYSAAINFVVVGMSAHPTDVNQLWREHDHNDQTVFVTFDVEDVVLVADVICTGKIHSHI